MLKLVGSNSLRAVFAVLIAACLFGTSASARALADVQVDSIAIACIRLLIGSLGLFAISYIFERSDQVLTLLRNPMVWLMAVAVAGYQYFFFVGTDLAGIALGTLVSLALAPFFAGLLAWKWKGRKPARVWYFSTITGVIGLACLSLYALDSALPFSGLFAALVASFSYATYTVIGSESAMKYSPIALLAVSFLIAAVVLLPFSLGSFGFLESPRGVLLSMWLGIIATAVAYAFFAYGLSRLQAGVIATLNLAEPLVATILGVVIIGEQLGVLAIVGCVMIAVALSQLALSHR